MKGIHTYTHTLVGYFCILRAEQIKAGMWGVADKSMHGRWGEVQWLGGREGERDD